MKELVQILSADHLVRKENIIYTPGIIMVEIYIRIFDES